MGLVLILLEMMYTDRICLQNHIAMGCKLKR